MTKKSYDDFTQELECIYKGERHSARDNGSVMRHPRTGKHKRPKDNIWTFGWVNKKNGYMYFSNGVSIHSIIATAFHGASPSQKYVVDHKDTNRQNNCPENLEWITRLDNLHNPITKKKINSKCGSVESFLENPSKMPTYVNWIDNPRYSEQKNLSGINEADSSIQISKTPNAAQRNWKTLSEFPCCPAKAGNDPVESYLKRLKAGSVFACNNYGESVVCDAAIFDNSQSILIITENKGSIKPWALAKVTYEDGLYVHESIGSFFTKEGVQKQFFLNQGLEWDGGDSIDDYC